MILPQGDGSETVRDWFLQFHCPSAVALSSIDLRLPYLLLPETVGAKLPETLQEANTFGQRDKYLIVKPPRTEKYQQPAEQKVLR